MLSGRGLNVLRRRLHVTSCSRKLRDKIVWEEDLGKRPSDVEIRRKELPPNTPTLGERMRRDSHHVFHETDRKGGYYHGDHANPLIAANLDTTFKEAIFNKESWMDFYKQCLIWKSELPYNHLYYPVEYGDTKTEWSSDDADAASQWQTACDSEWGEGYSHCDLVKSPETGKLTFSGQLSTRKPQDGRNYNVGYVNMSTREREKSFHRRKFLEWEDYTHIYLRVRGDGRTYMLNLHPYREFDIQWHDLHCYPLYTRGGPYWQDIKIPFRKFYLTNMGYVQDNQQPLIADLEDIFKISISLMDSIDGPFSLEIDHIGVEANIAHHDEVTAYEEYVLPTNNWSYD